MMTVLLIIHLFVTIGLVGMVLVQRSEGGGLGIGGGGGGGGFMTTRGTANIMTKLTVGLAATFFATSILLSILAGTLRQSTGSVVDSVVPTEESPFAQPIEEPAQDSFPDVPVGE